MRAAANNAAGTYSLPSVYNGSRMLVLLSIRMPRLMGVSEPSMKSTTFCVLPFSSTMKSSGLRLTTNRPLLSVTFTTIFWTWVGAGGVGGCWIRATRLISAASNFMPAHSISSRGDRFGHSCLSLLHDPCDRLGIGAFRIQTLRHSNLFQCIAYMVHRGETQTQPDMRADLCRAECNGTAKRIRCPLEVSFIAMRSVVEVQINFAGVVKQTRIQRHQSLGFLKRFCSCLKSILVEFNLGTVLQFARDHHKGRENQNHHSKSNDCAGSYPRLR